MAAFTTGMMHLLFFVVTSNVAAVRLGEGMEMATQSRAQAYASLMAGSALRVGAGLDTEMYLPAQYITRLRAPNIPDTKGRWSLAEGAMGMKSRMQLVSSQSLKAFREFRDEGSDSNAKSDYAIPTTQLRNLVQEYVGPIGVGTVHSPPGCASLVEIGETLNGEVCQEKEQQMLNVVFDTGSTNLWMASTLCKVGPCAYADRNRYDLRTSETYEPPKHNGTWEVSFATAQLRGPSGVDNFHIGPFTVRNQSFDLIQSEVGTTFEQLPLEGIVGLAFPSMSTGGAMPFFDNVIKQKVLQKNTFAFYLSSTDPGQGAVLWGGVDKRLFEGKMAWFPVTQPHYWAMDLYGLKVGNETVDLTHSRDQELDWRWGSVLAQDSTLAGSDGVNGGFVARPPLQAPAKLIVDSGTTYYAAESGVYNALSRHAKASCRNGGVLPDITYRLKDINGRMRDLVVTHEDYNIGFCEAGFMQVNLKKEYGPAMLLGELFMRKYFTVHDRGDGSDKHARVGMARAKEGLDF